MEMNTDAALASETEAEGLAFAREVLRIEAEAIERVQAIRIGKLDHPVGRIDLSINGERDCHGDG